MDHTKQEVTVGQRLARASSGILSSRHRMEPPISRDDCYAATHPSDHNSTFVFGRSAWKREYRQAEWRRRREKEGEKIGKGKRGGKQTEIEERYLRGRDHEFPFSLPVSKVHGYGCPHVQQKYAPACAVVCIPAVFSAPSYCQGADASLGCIWMRCTLGKAVMLLINCLYLCIEQYPDVIQMRLFVC